MFFLVSFGNKEIMQIKKIVWYARKQLMMKLYKLYTSAYFNEKENKSKWISIRILVIMCLKTILICIAGN